MTCVNGRPGTLGYNRTVKGTVRDGILRPLLLLAGLSASIPGVGAEQAAGAPLDLRHEPGVLTLEFKGRPLLVYAFATNQFKPYVRALYTLQGEDVLRDAPADHLHHHGLMYAVRVNDVNFWEERDAPGHEIPVKLVPHRPGRTRVGLPTAGFTQVIHWVAHGNAAAPDSRPAALLVERRTLTLTVDEPRGEVALRWQAGFESGPAAERVKLHGSGYNGLGLRLPAAWDHVARHANSENAPYTAEQQWDVTPARWAAVSHAIGGRDITVALFGRPSNPGDTRFFSMLHPFTYLSVTQNLEKSPQEYARGDRFCVDYLVLVKSGALPREVLEQHYRSWISETPNERPAMPASSSSSTHSPRP